jgi:hypothetical protein
MRCAAVHISLVDAAAAACRKGDVFIHADLQGAPVTIIKSPDAATSVPPLTISQASVSRQVWTAGLHSMATCVALASLGPLRRFAVPQHGRSSGLCVTSAQRPLHSMLSA